MSNEIKPIPGIEGRWRLSYHYAPDVPKYSVECMSNDRRQCLYDGPVCNTEQEAIDAHNAQVDAVAAASDPYKFVHQDNVPQGRHFAVMCLKTLTWCTAIKSHVISWAKAPMVYDQNRCLLLPDSQQGED